MTDMTWNISKIGNPILNEFEHHYTAVTKNSALLLKSTN